VLNDSSSFADAIALGLASTGDSSRDIGTMWRPRAFVMAVGRLAGSVVSTAIG